jgi:heme o synthase
MARELEHGAALEAEVSASVRDYWTLLKPNVMRLVLFSAWVGLFLAPGELHPFLAFVAILCIGLGAGAAAALNNAYDCDIDRKMRRTRHRPTAEGRIPPAEATALGVTFAIVAVMLMGLAVSWAAAALLALTIGFYVLVYTMWLKRRTPQNIVIGGAAGAFPPLVGWAAVTGEVTLASLTLFLIILLWTPPHFWALSLYRAGDYARAGVPMMPVVRGDRHTRRQILAYTLILVPVTLLPALIGLSGIAYLAAAVALGLGFVAHALRLQRDESEAAARGAFRYSVIYLFALFLALVVDRLLLDAGIGGLA